MLEKVARIAGTLYAWRSVGWVLTGLGGAIAVLGTLSGGDPDRFVLPAIVGFLWGAFLLGVAYSFAGTPRQPHADDRLWIRFRIRLGRTLRWLLLVGALALGLELVMLSLRALGLFL